ncbi:MAG: hypothetical protein J6B64_00235 [Bacilli bacterium]|nr:hypothetical protein [Bacilli bacterium]MBP3635559.1 hypothetical protein [Bacilli bacterium]
MNDFLQKVMTFINENTYILIGICVFLILVLIGYLIDNSVKSKRVRNDIKNKDQVPENIKNEIIEEANKEKVNVSSITNEKDELDLETSISKKEDPISLEIDDVNVENSEREIPTNNYGINLDSKLNIPIQNLSSNDITSNPNIDDMSNDLISENLKLDSNKYTNSVNESDPDLNIMLKENDSSKLYKNDKKLSEILSKANIEEKNNSIDSNIFDTDISNITVNKDVEKNKVDIESNNSDDELEKIMKKLSSMNNSEDDNYTNIF